MLIVARSIIRVTCVGGLDARSMRSRIRKIQRI